jgi:hypothetical protein
MGRPTRRDERRADRATRGDFLLAVRDAETARDEEALVELLSSARARGRTGDVGFAAQVLAKEGADARLPVLLAMLEDARADGDRGLGLAALAALRQTRDDGAIPVFAQALRERSDSAERTHAALGLAEIGSEKALVVLRDALTSTDDRIVRAAARALWFATALDDDDPRVLLRHANWRFRWAMRRRRALRRLSGGPTTPEESERTFERRRPVARGVHLAVTVGASAAAVLGLLATGVPWPLAALGVPAAILLAQVVFTHLLASVPGLPWRARSLEVSDVVKRVRDREGDG